MNAAGYTRISDPERAREGYGLSAQEQAIRHYCAAMGWELVEVYSDGRTGKTMEGRDGLSHLMEDAQQGRFERVVFWKIDRLARNLADMLAISDRLEAMGIGVVSIQEAFDSSTPVGRMLRNVLGSFAQFEREVIVERIKAGLAEKQRQGELVGPLPQGYRRSDDGKSVEIEPVAAALVHEAFIYYATGDHSLRDLATWAAGIGFRTQEGNPHDRLSLRKILTNITYTGKVTRYARKGGGVVADGRHPAIINEETFRQVQAALQRRRYRQPRTDRPYGKEPYPLTGTAICGYDGVPLLGLTTGNRPWLYRYMRCSTAQRRGKDACQQGMVRAELLESQVVDYVSGMQLPDDYVNAAIAELRRRRPSEGADPAESSRLRREIDRWQRLFVLGEIDEDDYRRETRPLRQRLASLERPQEVLDVQRAVNGIRQVGELWQSESRVWQQQFIREVFARIVVKGPQVTEFTPRTHYKPLFVLDRQQRFGGTMCMLAPRAGFEPTT